VRSSPRPQLRGSHVSDSGRSALGAASEPLEELPSQARSDAGCSRSPGNALADFQDWDVYLDGLEPRGARQAREAEHWRLGVQARWPSVLRSP